MTVGSASMKGLDLPLVFDGLSGVLSDTLTDYPNLVIKDTKDGDKALEHVL